MMLVDPMLRGALRAPPPPERGRDRRPAAAVLSERTPMRASAMVGVKFGAARWMLPANARPLDKRSPLFVTRSSFHFARIVAQPRARAVAVARPSQRATCSDA